MIRNTGHVPGMYHPLQVEASAHGWIREKRLINGSDLTSAYNQAAHSSTLLPDGGSGTRWLRR